MHSAFGELSVASGTRSGESGSALLAVLALILSAALLIGVISSLTNQVLFSVKSHTVLQKSFYQTESAAMRIAWLIASDRARYTISMPGDTDYSEYEYDRFMADGVVHKLNSYGTDFEFVILDANSGVDVQNSYSGNFASLKNGRNEDTVWTEALDRLSECIGDYLDSDDDVFEDGWEAPEYEDADMEPLPRNGQIQFREELYYIPSFAEIFPPDSNGRMSQVRLIPLDNLADLSGTGSLFGASALELETGANLDEGELQEVLSALENWRNNRERLSDQLDPFLLQRLRNAFSWQESGNYTVLISPMDGQNHRGRRLAFSFPAFDISGPDGELLRCLEWFYF